MIILQVFSNRQKLSPQTTRDLILTGKRYDGPAALKAGLIDDFAEPEELFEKGMKMAESLCQFGSDRTNFKKLKEELYKVTMDACFNKGLSVGIRVKNNFCFIY